MSKYDQHKNLEWLDGETVRPYVFVRDENRIQKPGTVFDSDWFPFAPVYFNPLKLAEVSKADQIMNLEHKAFDSAGLAMDRWVFYDCAIMPGFVAGFAQKTESLSEKVKNELGEKGEREWTPISLFIVIPAIAPGEWVAHNLCSINTFLSGDEKYYGLGFLTKAFGLWHANVQTCLGMTQWTSPALRLHAHYGPLQVLTAWTPAHSYPNTLTYRMETDPGYWTAFFTKQPLDPYLKGKKASGLKVHPKEEESLKELQKRIEAGEGPFYLDSHQVRRQPVGDTLDLFCLNDATSA